MPHDGGGLILVEFQHGRGVALGRHQQRAHAVLPGIDEGERRGGFFDHRARMPSSDVFAERARFALRDREACGLVHASFAPRYSG
jgi:hypothetical protein